MKLVSNVSCVFTALALLPLSVAQMSASFPTPTSLGARSQQENHVKGNLSYLLGWQMTGMAGSTSQLEVTCENFHSVLYGKWEAVGLIPQFVELPICGNVSSTPTPSDVAPHQTFYETSVLLTQLLYSFNVSSRTEAYSYLCANVRRNILSTLYLDDDRIMAALCQQPGTEGGPGLQLPLTRLNVTILKTYRDSMSTLFGLEMVATARNKTDLDVLCHDVQIHNRSLVDEMLNPPVVSNTVCKQGTPLPVRAARSSIANQISVTFLGVVSVISNAPGYLDWLCSHLDSHSMDALGMMGSEVKLAVCGLVVLEQLKEQTES